MSSGVYVIGTPEGAKKNQWNVMTNDVSQVLAAKEEGLVVKEIPPENLRPRRRKRGR